MSPKVTVITPTTGSDQLSNAVNSVSKQTYSNIEHIVVVDKPTESKKVYDLTKNLGCLIVNLPYNTGHSGYNGHRIYGAFSYLVETDFICFLDQDNWYDPDHIETLVGVINAGNKWAYSLRKIVDQQGEYICNDDCESLGRWKSVLNDNFIDVNCFMIPKHAAISFSPYWYRRARHPQEQPEVDRILSAFMMQNFTEFNTNGIYSVNYRVASRKDSVQDSFFINGNNIMKQKMNGEYPWRKKT
jgi:glycosyltransferase involved in cell wall biosynthesis